MSSIMRGREITTIRIGSSGNHEVVKMIVEVNNQKQLLIYFFDVDGYITTSQSMIRLQSLKKRLQLKRTSATLVRLMAPLEGSQDDSMKVLLGFFNEIYTVLPDYTYTDRIKK